MRNVLTKATPLIARKTGDLPSPRGKREGGKDRPGWMTKAKRPASCCPAKKKGGADDGSENGEKRGRREIYLTSFLYSSGN